MGLVVQNDAEQRTVNLQSAFRATRVINKPQLSEAVHEKADPRTNGSDHFSQTLLTDFWDDNLRHAFLAKVRAEEGLEPAVFHWS